MSTEIARRKSGTALAMAAHVDSIGQLMGLLERLHDVGVIPDGMSMSQAVMACMAGARFGMDPITAMNSFYIVNNRATMAASAMQAICLDHPDCLYFTVVESTMEVATYETHRRGAPDPVRISYSKADATKAGLWGKGTWAKHPAQMLVARCSSRLARAVYPDALHGMYTREEMTNGEATDDADMIDVPYTPTPQRPASVMPTQVEHVAEAEPEMAPRDELMRFIAANGLTMALELYWAARSPDAAKRVEFEAIKSWKQENCAALLATLKRVLGAGQGHAMAALAEALGRPVAPSDVAALDARIEWASDEDHDGRSKAIAAALLADRCVEKPETVHLRLGLPKVEKGGEA